MARFKARVLGLVTVLALAVGIATLFLWQEPLATAQAAQEQSPYVDQKAAMAGTSAQAVLAGGGTAEPTEETVEQSNAAPQETPQPSSVSAASGNRTYEVQAGDTLIRIAKKFHITVDALVAANNLDRTKGLIVSQILIIPDAVAAPLSDATAEATEEATEEATAETTEEATEEATAEATEEATAEVTEEPTAEIAEEGMDGEATSEATEEATAEATEEATQEATAEATQEATEEATEESMTEEGTPEPTEEALEETTAEPTTAEPTEEATAQATAEATTEATEEATTEATAEPTEEVAEEGNLLETIIEMGEFTTLLEALEAAGLSETLTTEGPFTLFAPTDAAFDALPPGTVDGLLASSPDDLGQILLYHLLPGEVFSTDLADGATVITAQGSTVTITITPEGIQVNDALITMSDIQTSNGVIHVIDTVLLPSDNVAAAPNGAAATPTEAASPDAASVIVAPMNVEDATAAARLWEAPADNIALFSPVAAGGYHSPIEIIGLSKTFEGNLAIHLTTTDGTLLAQRMTLGGADAQAFFRTDLRFYVDETIDATLSILEIDMAEGTTINAVETAITLIPGQRFIDVTTPLVGQTGCNPLLVSGYSNTFEANVLLTLRGLDGSVLAQMPAMGGTLGVYRDFAATFDYAVDAPTPVLLSVAETDASGLLETIDETVIPVTLYPAYSAACY